MHTFVQLILTEESTDNVADTGSDMHKRPFLACMRSPVRNKLHYAALHDVPKERPDATESAKPTDFVKSVLPPR